MEESNNKLQPTHSHKYSVSNSFNYLFLFLKNFKSARQFFRKTKFFIFYHFIFFIYYHYIFYSFQLFSILYLTLCLANFFSSTSEIHIKRCTNSSILSTKCNLSTLSISFRLSSENITYIFLLIDTFH